MLFDRLIGSGDDNGWRHVRIVLEPLSSDFEPIELTAEDEDSITVVAELVEVLGVEHRPVAEEPCEVVLLEPGTTLNTGNVDNERTVRNLERV